MLHDHLIHKITTDYDAEFNEALKIIDIQSVGGGSINEAYCLTAQQGVFFLKINRHSMYTDFFEKEFYSLRFLKENTSFLIPTPLLFSDIGGEKYLLMEYVQEGEKGISFWKNFAKHLAAMHRKSHRAFGFHHDNFMGSLPQRNSFKDTWADFFFENRIEPQFKLAVDRGYCTRFVNKIHQLHAVIENGFPTEDTALVHGDLWAGNYLVGPGGESVIIDPALYYGHREIDIAMTFLFGGFDSELYQYYHDFFPLEQGWKNRIGLCNLYPLLVHVNLFGAAYEGQVENILKKLLG